MVEKYGCGGTEAASSSYDEFIFTKNGQAELNAFTQRIDDRIQLEWRKLPADIRQGTKLSSRSYQYNPEQTKACVTSVAVPRAWSLRMNVYVSVLPL